MMHILLNKDIVAHILMKKYNYIKIVKNDKNKKY